MAALLAPLAVAASPVTVGAQANDVGPGSEVTTTTAATETASSTPSDPALSTTDPAVATTDPVLSLDGVNTPSYAGAPWFRPGYPYTGNFPDPTVAWDGTKFWAYGTSTGGSKMPAMSSNDLQTWIPRPAYSPPITSDPYYNDSFPTRPAWATGNAMWAPGVAYLAGMWVAYTSWEVGPGRRCIGVARSSSPQGPFVEEFSQPFVCDGDPGGSIDAQPFIDVNGQPYLMWKSAGIPGSQPTKIKARALRGDGLAWAPGSSTVVLLQTELPWDGNSIENPSMVRYGGTYWLIYSGNEWESADYRMGQAACAGPLGPCTRTSGLPLIGNTATEWSPGGGTLFIDTSGRLRVMYQVWNAPYTSYPTNPNCDGPNLCASQGQRSYRLEGLVASGGHLTVDPVGSLDQVTATAGGIDLSGWALDPSRPDPIYVHVYVDGVGAGALLASGDRPDVGAAVPGLGNAHGYSTSIAVSPGTHQVCTYGIGIGTPGNSLLGCRTVVVAGSPPGAPSGAAAVAAPLAATVTWNPPSSTGGAPITSYTVTASPGGATCTWTAGPLSCTVAGLTSGTSYTFNVRATNAAGTGNPSSSTSSVTPTGLPAGAYYNPIVPTRIIDSRSGDQRVGPLGPWGAGQTQQVQVTGGLAGVPSDATAVVLNVTATGGNANGNYLTIWPSGAAQPAVSSLNVNAGQTIANAVTVKLGAGAGNAGRISIFNAGGSQNVIVDVAGYYSTAPADGFTALAPTRIIDSRPAPDRVGPLGTWGAGQTRQVQVGGLAGVPSDADAVVLNVTATGGNANGNYLTIWPSGAARPTVSSLNVDAGQTVANQVTVKLGTGGADAGKLSVFNAGGAQNVILDVAGYFKAGTGSAFYPLAPSRVIDTRNPPQRVGPLGPWSGSVTQVVNAVGGYSTVPSVATAVVMNVTATGGNVNGGYLTIWPTGTAQSTVSSLNFNAGQTVPNAVTVRLGTGGANAGRISIFNAGGNQHAILDVAGFYA